MSIKKCTTNLRLKLILSLINKNMYMYMLNIKSKLLLMYDIITQWKTSKFSAFNYTFRLVCMLYFLFAFLLLFVSICILFPSMCSVLSHSLIINFHIIVNYQIYMLTCVKCRDSKRNVVCNKAVNSGTTKKKLLNFTLMHKMI